MKCNGCGGIVGIDCYNPQECEQITNDDRDFMAAEIYSKDQLIESLEAEKSELIEALKNCQRIINQRAGLTIIELNNILNKYSTCTSK